MEKSTHDEYRAELFMPIMKEADGKYIAVLSDNSVDRDEEKLSKGCIEKLGYDNGYLAALCNHQNDVFMMVAEWTNRGVKEVDGFTALVAEPNFFTKSSPQARQIKGMLDEGAKIGISIGALVKSYDDVDGMRVFTELELVEASFVAVPSNKHGRALAIAKSFNTKNTEAIKMDKEFTQKDIDSAVEKKVEEVKTDLTKQLESKDAEIVKLQTDLKKAGEESEQAKEDADTAAEDAEAEAEESKKKLKEAEKKAETEKKKALEKQKHADEGGEPAEETQESVDKAFKEGKLPVMIMER